MDNKKIKYVCNYLLLFIPIIAMIVSFYNIIQKNEKKYYLLFLLSISLQAYMWNPSLRGSLYDLVRWHSNYNIISNSTFLENLSKISLFKPTPFILLWILSFFNNPRLVQSVIGFLTMYFYLEIIRDELEDTNSKFRFIILILFLVSIRYLFVISNLWNDLANSLFIFSYLKVNDKLRKYILYILAFTIHPSVIIPLLLIWLIKKIELSIVETTMYVLFIIMFLYLGFYPIIRILTNVLDLDFLNVLAQRYISYAPKLFFTLDIWSVKHYLIELSKLLLLLYVVIIYNRLAKNSHIFNPKPKESYKIGIVFSVVVCLLGLFFPQMYRFNIIPIVLMINYIKIYILPYCSKHPIDKNIIFFIVIPCSIMCVIYFYYQVNSLYHAYFFENLFVFMK